MDNTALQPVDDTMPVAATSVDEAHDVMKHHARSFRWASWILPQDAADDAAVAYAFFRLADDLVDEAPDVDTGRARLLSLRDELDDKRPRQPLTSTFVEMCDRRGIPLEATYELFEGILSDTTEVRIANDAELVEYCYRVAGCVGLVMCGILGVTDKRAWPHAVDLGIGMQLTNLCRDVKEDWERSRVYLSAERIDAQGGLVGDDVMHESNHEVIAKTVKDHLQLAERYYASADAGLPYIPFRARLAIGVASRVYRAIGKVVAARRYAVWKGRAIVSPVAKIGWLVWGLVRTPLQRKKPHVVELHKHLVGKPGASSGVRALPPA